MAIKNFSQYLIEAEREVFFTFGRMNPPTIGHGKVLETLAKKSGKNDYKVFTSQVSNAKKDPLSYSDKIKHMRKMFPKHGRSIIINKKIRTAFDAVTELYDQGYRKVNMIVGSDRVREFDTILQKYNGVKGRHGFYNFESINVMSAGERDPDAEGVLVCLHLNRERMQKRMITLHLHKEYQVVCQIKILVNYSMMFVKAWD